MEPGMLRPFQDKLSDLWHGLEGLAREGASVRSATSKSMGPTPRTFPDVPFRPQTKQQSELQKISVGLSRLLQASEASPSSDYTNS